MFLKSLELTGFKSFAKRTKLQFEPGITGIVGPNGSGKSNIADAIRWVLGAQSKKAVRGKVSSDVIFSGSGSKPAMSMAEVSLVFDNANKLLPYEYDEVIVTRRLYRSGDSEYLVNGAQTRLTDLQHAFAVAGIGAENYTVIGQGLVDKVLSQSAKERRSLFEEAAGVRQFQIKRDEARRKLTETTTNLSRTTDIIKELEPRLKLLRRQASVLAQKDELEKSLAEGYLAKYGHRYREFWEQYQATKGRKEELNKEFLAIGAELEKLSSKLEALRRSQQGHTLSKLLAERNELRDTADSLRDQVNQANTAKEVAEVSIARIDDQHRQLEDRRRLLDEQEPKARPIDAGVAEQLTQTEAELASIDAKYQTASQALSALTTPDSMPKQLSKVLDSLERAIRAGAGKDELNKHVLELRQLVNRLAGEDEAATEQNLVEQTQAIMRERDEIQKRLQELRITHAANEQIAKQQQIQRARHDQELAAVTSQLERLALEKKQHHTVLADSTQTITKLSDELTALEASLKTLEAQIAVEQQSSMGETEELDEAEKRLNQKRRTHDEYRNELSSQNIELAKLETRLDDLAAEAKPKLGSQFPPADALELPASELGKEENIVRLERKVLEIGGIDPEVASEHQESEERYEFLSSQVEDLHKAKSDLETLIRSLERQSQTIFKEAFTKINTEFGKHFTTLFGGGKAELLLIEEQAEDEQDEDAPREYGIDIKATPPGKRVQNLSMLSGGERAMTSVALLFAILTVNPSPFVMLDEVDAALDEANTARFAETLKGLTGMTQFLVVTHNRDTMRICETLYGVTMDETAMSTMLSIKLAEAEKVAQAA